MKRGRPRKLELKTPERLEFDPTSTIFQCTLELLSPKTQKEIQSVTYFDELSALTQNKFVRAERRFKFSQKRTIYEPSSSRGEKTSTPRVFGGIKKRLTPRPTLPTTPNPNHRTVFEESAEFEYDLDPNALSLSPDTRRDSISNLADGVIDLINNTQTVTAEIEGESSTLQSDCGNIDQNVPIRSVVLDEILREDESELSRVLEKSVIHQSPNTRENVRENVTTFFTTMASKDGPFDLESGDIERNVLTTPVKTTQTHSQPPDTPLHVSLIDTANPVVGSSTQQGERQKRQLSPQKSKNYVDEHAQWNIDSVTPHKQTVSLAESNPKGTHQTFIHSENSVRTHLFLDPTDLENLERENTRVKAIARDYLSKEGGPDYVQRVTQLQEARAHWQNAQDLCVQLRKTCASAEAHHLSDSTELNQMREQMFLARESYSDLVEILECPEDFSDIIKYRTAIRRKAIYQKYDLPKKGTVTTTSCSRETINTSIPTVERASQAPVIDSQSFTTLSSNNPSFTNVPVSQPLNRRSVDVSAPLPETLVDLTNSYQSTVPIPTQRPIMTLLEPTRTWAGNTPGATFVTDTTSNLFGKICDHAPQNLDLFSSRYVGSGVTCNPHSGPSVQSSYTISSHEIPRVTSSQGQSLAPTSTKQVRFNEAGNFKSGNIEQFTFTNISSNSVPLNPSATPFSNDNATNRSNTVYAMNSSGIAFTTEPAVPQPMGVYQQPIYTNSFISQLSSTTPEEGAQIPQFSGTAQATGAAVRRGGRGPSENTIPPNGPTPPSDPTPPGQPHEEPTPIGEPPRVRLGEIIDLNLNIFIMQATACANEFRRLDVMLRELRETPLNTDSEYANLRAEYESVMSRLDRFEKDSRSAIDLGLNQSHPYVQNLTAQMNLIQQISVDIFEKLSECAKSRNIWTNNNFNQNVSQVTIPIFNPDSDKAKLNYFEFKSKFDQYTFANRVSDEAQLNLLKTRAVKGTAEQLIRHCTNSMDIFDKLRELYGSPTVLIKDLMTQLKEFGSCPANPPESTRQWLQKVKLKIEDLLELAEQNDMSAQIRHGELISMVRGNLPKENQKSYDKKLTKLVTARAFRPFSADEEFVILKDFLNELSELAMASAAIQSNRIPFNLTDTSKEKNVNNKTAKRSYQAVTEPVIVAQSSTEPIKNNSKLNTPQSGSSQSSKSQNKSNKSKQKSNKPNKGQNVTNLVPPAITPALNTSTTPVERQCRECSNSHTHLLFCEKFQQADPALRYKMTGNNHCCVRCLRMDASVSFTNRKEWFESHKNNCVTDFSCIVDKCSTRSMDKQVHITCCKLHKTENEKLNKKLVDSLDVKKIPQNLTFFYTSVHANTNVPLAASSDPTIANHDTLAPMLMVQNIPGKNGEDLLVFWDTGCSSAVISTRAVQALQCRELRPGPSQILVTSANTFTSPHGDQEVIIENEGLTEPVRLVALQLDAVSHDFPLWKTKTAYDEICSKAKMDKSFNGTLPPTDQVCGGVPCDLIIGMRYLNLFPTPIYSLPSGLSLYKSKFKSADGNFGLLAGVHSSWVHAHKKRKEIGHMCFFTQAMRAHVQESIALKFTKPLSYYSKDVIEVESDLTLSCYTNHCKQHASVEKYTHDHYSPEQCYGILRDEQEYHEVDSLATAVQYRCPTCRSCSKCKAGPSLEDSSIQSEAEQLLIENSVIYDQGSKKLIATLPFITDPITALSDNINTAKSILASQIKLTVKNPQLLPDILKAHLKLVERGYSVRLDDLSPDIQSEILSAPRRHYFVWRCVWKASSLSSPCRLIVDGSQSTPGKTSLNACLAKGTNNLALIFSILIKFRAHRFGFSADISCAYNNIELDPSCYKYQLYLWKHELCPESPIEIRVIKSIIYGVRSSGQQLEVGLRKLAETISQQHPEHKIGAEALTKSIYVDDIIHPSDSRQESEAAASSVKFILDQANIKTKSVIFSGQRPPEDVSSDSVSVSLLGYGYRPEKDSLNVEIKPIYFGKTKRGRLPTLVEDDKLESELAKIFTKRTLLQKAAAIFDPCGLLCPLTSRIKHDLHQITLLKTGWDEILPTEYLSTWVQNIRLIQEAKKLEFPRSVVPENAMNDKFSLIVSCDASTLIAACSVHARFEMTDGSFSCNLLAAKSKLVSQLTVPRAELRACLLGASLAYTIKMLIPHKITKIYYVVDSQICLFWLNSDKRILQTAVKNCVIEIMRLTDIGDWHWIPSTDNVADLPTRRPKVCEIFNNTSWSHGSPWMSKPESEWPTKKYSDLMLSPADKEGAKVEIKKQFNTVYTTFLTDNSLELKFAQVYKYSNYLYDPAKRSWLQALRVMAYVHRACARFKMKKAQRMVLVPSELPTSDELKCALLYYFKIATKEVKKFMSDRIKKLDTTEVNGILHFSGRILHSDQKRCLENILYDVSSITYLRPIIIPHSPLAYSIMLHSHEYVHHRSVINTLSISRQIAYIIDGRKVATTVRECCPKCRRNKAKLCKVESAPVDHNRFQASLPYTVTMIDLCGPFQSYNGLNKRSPLKVYAALFKCTVSSHLTVHAMDKYDRDSFILAYQRFVDIHGHPVKIIIDQGSQLMAALSDMNITTVDLNNLTSGHTQRTVRFQTVPVLGHNWTGLVERSVKTFKEMFQAIFEGRKMSVLEFESAFSYVASQINCLPLATLSNYDSYDLCDVITPSRIVSGLNTNNINAGPIQLAKPSQMIRNLTEIQEAWLEQLENLILPRLIPKPANFKVTTHQPKIGDLVIFRKRDSPISNDNWTIGRISRATPGRDNLIRRVEIQYKNHSEDNFRTTDRALRSVAILYSEDEISLLEQLSIASKAAYYTAFYAK